MNRSFLLSLILNHTAWFGESSQTGGLGQISTKRDRFSGCIVKNGHFLIRLSQCFALAAIFALALMDGSALASDKKNNPDEIGNRGVGKGVNFYSLEKEISLGKEMAQEVELQSKIIGDPIVSEYINRIGQNLVRNSDAKVPFTIKLLDSEEVNAFALPGGFFFVNSGLVLKAESESELAGVMAHEIAHVAARHGTKQATREQIIDLASIPLIFMGGSTGFAVRQVLNIAIPLGLLQFSQAFEREADYLGLQYLYKTGYDPVSFVDFFERVQSMETKKPGSLSKVFSSHPMTSSRIKAAQKEIQKVLVAKREYVVNTSEFNDIKQRLAMLHSGRRVDTVRNPNRPRLRRVPGAGTDAADENGIDDHKTDQDGRPTLKRQPDQQ